MISRNSEIVFIAGAGDVLFPESAEVVAELKQLGLELYISSGDVAEVAFEVGRAVGIESSHIHAALSPEEKLALMRRLSSERRLAMVGDGANDIGALKAAYVGIGVDGGAEACLKSADLFIASRGVILIPKLLYGAAASMRVVKSNLIISLIYNGCGATLAMCGLVNPLVAAILMPLSSITVVSRALFGKSF